MPPSFRHILALTLLLGVSIPTLGDDAPPKPEALKPPPTEEFVVIPLRVHILSSSDLPEVDCALTDADIKRVLGKVNGIWHQAGVHWGLESLVREPAAQQDRFKMTMEADPADKLGVFRLLIPQESRSSDGMNVYYIHKFSVNGVYLGNRVAFVQETARLKPVPGGIDEPLPRVTAHELGHSLGLPHRQDLTNLLASGTTGTTLNEAEVDRAREKARSMPGSIPVPDLRKKAEEATARGEKEEARRLWTWLADLPGEAAAEARKRLDALGEPEKKDEAKPASP